MVERSTPDRAADQQAADALVVRVTAEVEAAGMRRRSGPRGPRRDASAAAPAGAGQDVQLRIGTEHRLDDPDGYVSPPGDWGGSVADMRYTSPHDVPFAGALGGEAGPGGGAGDAGWQERVASVPDARWVWSRPARWSPRVPRWRR